jgi:hypothetical protein
MAGRAIEVKVVFFDVLSVIFFLASQSEGPFLQEGIAPIPQGKSETEILVTIADSTETVFAPPISTGTGMLVREIAPGFTVGTVVLSHSSPSTLGEKGPPLAIFWRIRLSRNPSRVSNRLIHASPDKQIIPSKPARVIHKF